MTFRPQGFVIWLAVLSVIVAAAGYFQYRSARELHTSTRELHVVEGQTDPCSTSLHGKTCQARTCTRLRDVGYVLTRQCLDLLAEVQEGKLSIGTGGAALRGVVRGGGNDNNPSGRPGGPGGPPNSTPGGGVSNPGGDGNSGGGTTTPTPTPTPPMPIIDLSPLLGGGVQTVCSVNALGIRVCR